MAFLCAISRSKHNSLCLSSQFLHVFVLQQNAVLHLLAVYNLTIVTSVLFSFLEVAMAKVTVLKKISQLVLLLLNIICSKDCFCAFSFWFDLIFGSLPLTHTNTCF